MKTTPLAVTVENYGQLNLGQTQTNIARPALGDAVTGPSPGPTARCRTRGR